MINTVIFDLGGVLIDWNPKHLYRKIFDTEDQIDSFLANICTPDWNEQQDAGRPLAEATELLINKHPEYKTEINAFYGRWPEMLGGPIQGTVDIFQQLKNSGQYRIVALTNWSAETFPVALERYDFLQWFEGILVSGEEFIKKPDPKIYELILDRYTIDPSHAVFIDDSLRNVKAAEKCGIKSIQFLNPEDLADKLRKLGISLKA